MNKFKITFSMNEIEWKVNAVNSGEAVIKAKEAISAKDFSHYIKGEVKKVKDE